MNGVPVGAIQEIEFNASDRNLPVLVTALIDNSILIPDPSTPTVRASLLGSGARLELTVTLPLSTPTRNYERDKSVRLRGRVVALETRMLEELAPQLEPIIASFREMEKLSRNLNEFVRAPAQGEAPQAESLRGVVARFNSTLDRANTALDGATSWLNDEQLRTDVRDTANGASELMRDAAINLRALPEQRDLIDHAATLLGKNRSDFMLEAACDKARSVVLDQVFFSLDADKFRQFTKMLDAPPAHNPGLERLMAINAPWKTSPP